MPTYRLAKSLVKLRDQINELSPNRSKVSDGWIGDAAHSARASDHNPSGGIVHALDITHDPSHGIDSEKLANALLASRDPRIKYIISNKKIASTTGATAWKWRTYNGKNPHNHHMHVSVKPNPKADDTSPWTFDLKVSPTKAAAPVKEELPFLKRGAKGESVTILQNALLAKGYNVGKNGADGKFGKATEDALKAYQKAKNLEVDGRCGIYTWKSLKGK